MLDSLVRVSRRVDNPLLQKCPPSGTLITSSSKGSLIPFYYSISTCPLKLNFRSCPSSSRRTDHYERNHSSALNSIHSLVFLPLIRSTIMFSLQFSRLTSKLQLFFSWIIRSHNTLSSSFHSFSKVLLSFPSQYFFAISFPVIFRLWWILSPFQFILPNKFTLFCKLFFSN